MAKFKKLECLKNCFLPLRRSFSLKKLTLCGILCIVLYGTLHSKFDLVRRSLRNGKVKKYLYDYDKMKVGLSDGDEGVGDGGGGVGDVSRNEIDYNAEDHGKVTIAIVDQHQEGIFLFI